MRTPLVVEPASDWLVRTCNASPRFAAAAETRCGFCRCCSGRAVLATAPGGGVAYLALVWGVTHPSLTHTFSRRLCKGLRKHLKRIKNKAERSKETRTSRSASHPRILVSWRPHPHPHPFHSLTKPMKIWVRANAVAQLLIRKSLPLVLPLRLPCWR